MNERRINIYVKEKEDYFLEFLIFVFVIILAMMTIYKPSEIKGDSMLPGVENGDIAIMTSRTIRRGDVVIAETEKRLIKRVIGLPGDTIEFRKNGIYVDLYLNGELKNEDYIKEKMSAGVFEGYSSHWHAQLDKPFTLTSGYYYICGDNRNISEDSRSIGPVPKKEISGVVVKVFEEDSIFAKIIRFVYNTEENN